VELRSVKHVVDELEVTGHFDAENFSHPANKDDDAMTI
jgi:hypothetical protein